MQAGVGVGLNHVQLSVSVHALNRTDLTTQRLALVTERGDLFRSAAAHTSVLFLSQLKEMQEVKL